MRQTRFHHYVIDRAGDDAFVSGAVVGKRGEDGHGVVDVTLVMTNLRDVETSFADVTAAGAVTPRARRPDAGAGPSAGMNRIGGPG